MKKIRNSDWLGAVRLIPNSAILSMCYHIWREKTLHGKNKYGSQGSANSGNISLKFEVNSTLILPVKSPLNEPKES